MTQVAVNIPDGSFFTTAGGKTMTRSEILALMNSKGAITASGTFGKTTIHSPTMLRLDGSLIIIEGDGETAFITVEDFDTAMIRATHLVHKFGSAKISVPKKRK